MSSFDLGAFLKARRAQVRPADVGVRASSGRRVPGLRREEVAMLAGVSVDYYARLEQGRERNPSPAVLNALAGALELDTDLREHLFRLADLAPTPARPVDDAVDGALRRLLDSWPATPAMIINRQLDVLAHNDLAGALFNGFDRIDNLARMTFVDPFGARFYTDRERATTSCVAALRLALGHVGSAEQVRRLVVEAHAASDEFAQLWARHDVRGKTHEAKSFTHPDVGELRLEYNAFDVRGHPGHQLIVYQAAPGSADAEKLALLGSLSAPSESSRHG